MRKKKLMIVDDDELARSVIKVTLEAAGYKVMEAEDGFQAIELYKKSPVEVAILDFMMPKMTGIEVFAKLKEINPGIKVIILTGHNEVKSYLRAKEMGAFEYVVKPVDFLILRQMLANIFAA